MCSTLHSTASEGQVGLEVPTSIPYSQLDLRSSTMQSALLSFLFQRGAESLPTAARLTKGRLHRCTNHGADSYVHTHSNNTNNSSPHLSSPPAPMHAPRTCLTSFLCLAPCLLQSCSSSFSAPHTAATETPGPLVWAAWPRCACWRSGKRGRGRGRGRGWEGGWVGRAGVWSGWFF